MNWKALCCILAALTVGIMVGRCEAVALWVSIFPVAVGICIFLYSLILSRRHPFKLTSSLNLAVAVSLFSGIGIFAAASSRPSEEHFPAGHYEFAGKVVDFTSTNSGERLLVELSKLCRLEGSHGNRDVRNVKALVTLRDASDVSYGSFITGNGSFTSYDSPGNYYKRDYENYLKSKKILLIGYTSFADCSIVTDAPGPGGWFQRLRYNLERHIETTPLSPATKGFLISLLLGDKTYISKDERLTFSDAGVAHIFAVSGFHVSMIALFLIGILSIVLNGRLRKWKFLAVVPLVWFYVLIVGASPATLRAGIMITVGMLALFLQRKNNPAKTLAWAAILILAFYPFALWDVGFQLSIVCVGSLLLIAEPLNFMDHRGHPLLFKIVSIILVTITATFSGWIICAFYFHRFSLMFLPLNIIAVPLLPFYSAVAVSYILLFHAGVSIPILSRLLDGSYRLFHDAASLMSSLSVPFDNLHPNVISVLFWLAGVAAVAWLLSRRSPLRHLWAPASLFVLSLLSGIWFPGGAPEGIIVQRNAQTPSVMSYRGGHEELVNLDPTLSSEAEINGCKIVSLRSDNLSSTEAEAVRNADLILICSGCRDLPDGIGEIKKKESRIITHPSLHWRHERRIIATAREEGLPLHSLRYQGPLHLFSEQEATFSSGF